MQACRHLPSSPRFQGAILSPLKPVLGDSSRGSAESGAVFPSPDEAHQRPSGETVLTRMGKVLARILNRLFQPLRRFAKFSTEGFELQRYKTPIPGLGKAWEGKKILQLSDLHFYEFTSSRFCRRLHSLIESAQPDLIVFTGDLIHFGRQHLEKAKAFMASLSAPLGKFACLGNHDYTDDNGGQNVKQILAEAGFKVLVNESEVLTREGQSLYFSAPDDPLSGQPDIGRTVDRIPDQAPHICLSHNPQLADALAQSRRPPHLILSGHTHAGQFRARWRWLNRLLDKLRSSLVDFPLRYRDGWFQVHSSRLYVNRGAGSAWVAIRNRFLEFAMPPLRMNNPPEITVFELTSDHGPGTN